MQEGGRFGDGVVTDGVDLLFRLEAGIDVAAERGQLLT